MARYKIFGMDFDDWADIEPDFNTVISQEDGRLVVGGSLGRATITGDFFFDENGDVFGEFDQIVFQSLVDANARAEVTNFTATADEYRAAFSQVGDIAGAAFVAAMSGKDNVTGSASAEVASTHGGADTIKLFGGKDTAFAGAGRDAVYGGNGADSLYGNGGSDTLFGGKGADYLDGGDQADIIYGQAGADSVEAGRGKDKVFGGAGDDQIDGGEGIDRLIGGIGADWLDGDEGADRLFGGKGRDLIEGDEGNDILFGGAGADVFFFNASDNSNVVKDFRGGNGLDRIGLETDIWGGGKTKQEVASEYRVSTSEGTKLDFGDLEVLFENRDFSAVQLAGWIDFY